MKMLIGVLVLSIVIIGLVVLLPFVIDLSTYQDQYKPFIEEALNRKIHLQEIRLTVWPRIGARVSGFTVLDDQAFGAGPFATVSSLDVGVKLMPLLSGKVEVEEITLRDPVITVVKNENGVFNLATLGRAGKATPTAPSRAPIPSTEGPLKILGMLAVDRVSISGGKLTYRDLSTTNPAEYVLEDLDLLLQSVRLGQMPSLGFSAIVQPLHLPVKLEGTFGPLKDTTAIERIDLQLELGRIGFTMTGKIAGHDATFEITSPVINTADVPAALPLKKPVNVTNLRAVLEVKGQEAKLHAISFEIFEGRVKGEGTVMVGSDTPPFNGSVSIHGLQLGQALGATEAIPLSFSGTASADLSLKGRGFSLLDLARTLEGTGHVAVKDGRMEGVNLLQEGIAILKIAGLPIGDPKATVFSTIETDLAVGHGIMTIQRFLLDSHDFQATGGGTIGFDHKLNLAVQLNLSQELSGRMAGASPAIKLVMKGDRVVLPLTIGNTIEAPSYRLDLASVAGHFQEQVTRKAEEASGLLFGGTAKPQDLKRRGQEILKGLLGR